MPAPPPHRAFKATEIVSQLAQLTGWRLSGDGDSLAIEKTFTFADYYQTLAFVNALAFIAHAQDHHPVLVVQHHQCVVRWRSHDVAGLSAADFDCARQVDALLPEPASC